MLAESLRLKMQEFDRSGAGWRSFAVGEQVLLYPYLVEGASLYDVPDVLPEVMRYLEDWAGTDDIFEVDLAQEHANRVSQQIREMLSNGKGNQK